jgi:ubiquinone/menaquinone biosynthesis C-methylase UbiE
MDKKKRDLFAERIFNETNAAMSTLNLYLGYRLNLFHEIDSTGDVNPEELSQRTGYSLRYLREWLECMTAGGYIANKSDSKRFFIPDEHRPVLLDEDDRSYAIPFVCYIPSFASVLTDLIEAFKSGGGVPYDRYGSDLIEAIGVGNRPMFVNDYAEKWISKMPDIENRLKEGSKVADIGCGVGWSSITLAKAFPKIYVDAIDMDTASIQEANLNAQDAEVSKRITFHQSSLEESSLKGPYDLITAFEVIHDLAYPVKFLKKLHEIVSEDGAILIADEAVGETLEENKNFLGHLMYNFSVLHCLPQSLAFPDSAATGTVMSPSILREYSKKAGFTKVDILPIDNPLWRFYRLIP